MCRVLRRYGVSPSSGDGKLVWAQATKCRRLGSAPSTFEGPPPKDIVIDSLVQQTVRLSGYLVIELSFLSS